MPNTAGEVAPQNAIRNNVPLISLPEQAPDGLRWWVEQYFQFEVSTSPASQTVQRRDLALFLRFMLAEEGTDARAAWTPRLSRDFQRHLQGTLDAHGRRAWSDKTIIRMLAHLKTFAKWVHKLRPFPLGNPMAKIKLPAVGIGLEFERALTPGERRKLLDAPDMLLQTGGLPRTASAISARNAHGARGLGPIAIAPSSTR